MKFWTVYQWDCWESMTCNHKYFLSKDVAFSYYETVKNNEPNENWVWDEIQTED